MSPSVLTLTLSKTLYQWQVAENEYVLSLHIRPVKTWKEIFCDLYIPSFYVTLKHL